jgi:hypothetical protein
MLFSKKLEEGEGVDEDSEDLVLIIAHLIIQWFDKKHNQLNQLTDQILFQFFKNIVLYSVQKQRLIVQAIYRVLYCCLVEKYLDSKAI